MNPFGLANSRHANVTSDHSSSSSSSSSTNSASTSNNNNQHNLHNLHYTVAPAARPVPFARARESANWRAPAGSVMQNNMTSPPSSTSSISPTSPTSLSSTFTSERVPLPEKLLPASLWRYQGSHMPMPSADCFNNTNNNSNSHHHTTTNMAAAPGHQGNATSASNMVDRFGRLDLGDAQEHEHNIYAYCFDRGNGLYTRLIPADMLPALRDVPALEMSHENMVILPVPRGVGPEGRSSNLEPVVWKAALTAGGMNDNVQSQIDSIVASSPLQPKRIKVYCDKWVHEGTCAFTQQGCRFKHEMPHDKATQHALGLFHGHPAWWKKHQAELSRQQRDLGDVSNQPVAVVGSSNNIGPAHEQQKQHRERSASGHAAAPARSSFHQSDDDAPAGHGHGTSTAGVSSPPGRAAAGSVSSWQRPNPFVGIAQFSSPYGPIGTPRTRYAHEQPPPPTHTTLRRAPPAASSSIADTNPYSSLHQLEYRGDSPDTDKDEGVKIT
ncbi:hypothetical protein B0T22DRAFT_482438 [Podospora appendiculata]|uniref:C3H1-type domain-containing protein n=1 Tax=Podospora appendiculata TaxID=314037 RepID=A0AAE1CAC3_9PEZI|nr:hypothetical protein B0T22DRAFT_482438 [Podospora appendiculata]